MPLVIVGLGNQKAFFDQGRLVDIVSDDLVGVGGVPLVDRFLKGDDAVVAIQLVFGDQKLAQKVNRADRHHPADGEDRQSGFPGEFGCFSFGFHGFPAKELVKSWMSIAKTGKTWAKRPRVISKPSPLAGEGRVRGVNTL